MKARYFLVVVLAVVGALMAQAKVYNHKNVPSPKVQGQDFYVANPDGVLSRETQDEINALCTRLNTNTGVELAVVVIAEFDEDEFLKFLSQFLMCRIRRARVHHGTITNHRT